MSIKDFIGETTEYDKKEKYEARRPKSWLKSVSAFANGTGGMLIFGVSDDDTVVGLSDVKSDSEGISEQIKTYLSPIPQTIVEIKKINNKDILFVKVLSGNETPYYYIGDGTMQAFVRIGNESVAADSITLKRLVLRGNNSSFDALTSAYKLEDFAFTKLKERYKVWTGNSFTEKMYQSFGMVDNDGNLTNAGALLADAAPIYHSRLFCTRWNGLDKSGGMVDALDSVEYTGSLIKLLEEGMDFIKKHNHTMWKKTANSRVELPDYVERSAFETLVNALIHRDYLIVGSEVHIDIFDDRMMIYSPGGMPDGQNIQDTDIDMIPSTRRNPVLADIFNRLGFMERQGSGFGKIIGGYKSAANYKENKKPEFYSNRAMFTVTLKNLNYKVSDKVSDKMSDKMSDKTKIIIDFIAEHNDFTVKDIVETHNLAAPTVRRILSKFVNEGKLEITGNNKNRKYHVVKND